MKAALTVRPFDDQPLDRAGLADVVSHAFEHDRWVTAPLLRGRPLGPMFAAGALEVAERSVAEPTRAFCLLAARDEQIVGAALGHLEESLLEFTGVRVGTLWSLAVRRDLRRQGIGRRLFDEAVAWMRRAGCRQLNVGTDGDNPANELYQGAGCRPVHVLRTWSLDLEDDAAPGGPCP